MTFLGNEIKVHACVKTLQLPSLSRQEQTLVQHLNNFQNLRYAIHVVNEVITNEAT